MKTIPTKNGELLCVEVPMDAKGFEMSKEDYWQLTYWNGQNIEPSVVTTFDFNSIIGTITNGVLDFDAEPYVDSGFIVDPYSSMNMVKKRPASASFLSLLASHNIKYSGKKIVILSKK